MTRAMDSPRWCERCQMSSDYHTDRGVMGGVGAGGLRDQAVEAATNDLLGRNDDGRGDYETKAIVTNPAIASHAAERCVAAAEPFLRAQVIAEVVEALRGMPVEAVRGGALVTRRAVAAWVEQGFGGKHAD